MGYIRKDSLYLLFSISAKLKGDISNCSRSFSTLQIVEDALSSTRCLLQEPGELARIAFRDSGE